MTLREGAGLNLWHACHQGWPTLPFPLGRLRPGYPGRLKRLQAPQSGLSLVPGQGTRRALQALHAAAKTYSGELLAVAKPPTVRPTELMGSSCTVASWERTQTPVSWMSPAKASRAGPGRSSRGRDPPNLPGLQSHVPPAPLRAGTHPARVLGGLALQEHAHCPPGKGGTGGPPPQPPAKRRSMRTAHGRESEDGACALQGGSRHSMRTVRVGDDGWLGMPLTRGG